MADEIEPDAPQYPGPSRRALLKGAVVGAGAVFVAPTVLTLAATPAAASPAGCLSCGQQLVVNGAGTTVTGWSTVPPATAWTSVGGVFQASGGSGNLNRRQQFFDFSAACIARFNQASQPQAQVTLSARLRGNGLNTNRSVFRVEYFALPGATGTPLPGTTQLLSASATLPGSPTSVVGNIPIGTQSLRIRLDLFGSFLGFNPGQGDDLAVTVTAC